MSQDNNVVSIDGMFKSADQRNRTIQIIIYAHNLKAVAELDKWEEGTAVNLTLQNKEKNPA